MISQEEHGTGCRCRVCLTGTHEPISCGHGHVTPNPDGTLARCGGPGICNECSVELAAKKHVLPSFGTRGVRWDDAVLQALNELHKSHPEWDAAFLVLMLRAGQLTTDTKKCEYCGSGG